MQIQTILEEQWPYLVSLLPGGLDLDESARVHGALVRKRGISSANTLLRLVFAYALCGMTLRQTVAWAEMASIASISNVALLKRLRNCSSWMGHILGSMLADRAVPPDLPVIHPPVRLVDATTITQPGDNSTSYRIHLGYNLQSNTIEQIHLTDRRGGETLTRFDFNEQDIVLADAGYCSRTGLFHVAKADAEFIVRLNWIALPFMKDFDLLGWLRSIPDARAAQKWVWIKADRKNKLPALKLRLVATRKSEAAAEESRRKLARSLVRRQRKSFDPRSMEHAGYVCLVTSLDTEDLSTRRVLSLYRFRWQIEMAFKRLKGLLDLGNLHTKDPPMARTYLYTKLVGALLLDDLTERFLAFSPWGYR